MSHGRSSIGDWALILIALIVILTPSFIEVDVVKKLYHSSPGLFWLVVAAVVTGVGIALWLRRSHPEG